ncbi:MAG: ATP-binding cassette domain-containing protein [Actinomycetota bacterium]|nr:ATP-binding cassette domain-containing protein [Actinomycetota bacterium]
MLTLTDVHKRFGDVVALDGAGFSVERGRILGFLGPNAAGKTTMMRVIFDLVRPDAGEVRWNGSPVDAATRLRFGYMPEERGLYPKMKIGDQLVYFARLSGLPRQQARDAVRHWLDVLGLSDRADAKLEDLSHGNQQRAQLAVALAPNPELLVLDEPFSGLDPIGVESLSGTLRGLAAEGVTIVFSSHQLDLVEDVCEDVAIITKGRIVLAGNLAEIKARSTKRRLTIDVDGVPFTPDLRDIVVIENHGRSHCVVSEDAPVADILADAQLAGTVTRFSFEPPHLTDLFREAVEI